MKRGFIDALAIWMLTAGLGCAYKLHVDKPIAGYESEIYKLDRVYMEDNQYTYCFNKK